MVSDAFVVGVVFLTFGLLFSIRYESIPSVGR